jgi:hypothetical protein
VLLTFRRRSLGVELVNDNTQQAFYHPHTVEQFVRKYRRQRLLDCAKVRKIYWDGKTNGTG